MAELEKPWCPCQDVEFNSRHPDMPKEDMPYVNSVDYLERVKSKWYYEQKTKEARKRASDFAFNVGPSIPHTRRGIPIIEENFPEADLVCPCCEAMYEEVKTIKQI